MSIEAKIGSISGKLPWKVRMGYSFGNFGESVAYNMFYLFFLLFLTAVAGIDPAIAGTISLVAVLWDAITDPMIGYWSDHLSHKEGRRRPFFKRFAAPLGAVVVLMFTVFPGMSGAVQVAYFLVMNILFWFLFTCVDIPYISMAGELSTLPSEQTTLRTMATMWNYVGFTLAAAGTVPLLGLLSDKVNFPGEMSFLDPGAWVKVAVLMAACTFASFIVTYFVTKGRDTVIDKKEKNEMPNFFKEYIGAIKIKSFRPLYFFSMVSQVGGYIATALIMHYLIYYHHFSDARISAFFIVYSVFIIIMSPFMNILIQKFDKRSVLIVGNIINAVVLTIFWLIGTNSVSIFIWSIAIAFYFGSFYIAAFASTFDVAEVDKLSSGRKETRQGIIFAFFSFLMKAGIGIGMFISGLMLKGIGFDESVLEQSAETVKGLHTSITLGSASFFVAGSLILMFYPITGKVMKKVLAQIKNREEGKEVSLEGLEKIL